MLEFCTGPRIAPWYTAVKQTCPVGPYALTECRGDWKWHKESWDLRYWYRYNAGICFKCTCTMRGATAHLACQHHSIVVYNYYHELKVPSSDFNVAITRPAGRPFASLLVRYSHVERIGTMPRLTDAQFFLRALSLGDTPSNVVGDKFGRSQNSIKYSRPYIG